MNNYKVLNKDLRYISFDICLAVKGYKLYKYDPATNKTTYFSHLSDPKNALLSSCIYTRRLFRAEITHIYHFQNDTWMCIARKAIFRYNPATKLFEKCCDVEKGSRPMSLCQATDGTIYYGEYCYNPDMKPMRIFQSKDNGSTWTTAYTFEDGQINHIHGVFQDPYIKERIWVATGDLDKACIFGYTEDGFKTFVRKYEGSQKCRVCVPLFMEKEIIFATDSQYEQNYIRSINRETGEVTDIIPIQGSGINASQSGNRMLVSTTVEPSEVNHDLHSHVWYSEDGHKWREIASYKKDFLPKTYFQFGTVKFPRYEIAMDRIVFTGRSVYGIDGKSVIIDSKDIKG